MAEFRHRWAFTIILIEQTSLKQHRTTINLTQATGGALLEYAACFPALYYLRSTWIGTADIVTSGLYIIFREQRIKQRQMALCCPQDINGDLNK